MQAMKITAAFLFALSLAGTAFAKPNLTDAGESYRDFSPQQVSGGYPGFTIQCRISNTGTVGSGSFKVRFYASTDTVITPSDYLLGKTAMAGIAAGSSSDCSQTVGVFPRNIPGGTYYVGWIIDADDEIHEERENDNTAYETSHQLTLDGPVSFADANLKAAVAAALAVTDPTPYDMLSLTTLDAHGRGIVSLVGLEYATHLEILNVSSNQISSLSPLSGLTSLVQIDATSNQISDLSPLSGLSHLTILFLGDNQISNLSPLSSLAGLQALNVYDNQISNLSPLLNLTGLSSLNLDDNQISNISPLSGLTNLVYLYLDNNHISSLSPLSGMTRLQDFSVSGNPLDEDAYCIYLPLILANNPICSGLQPFDYDPNPYPPKGVSATDGTYLSKVVVSWNARCFVPHVWCDRGYESYYRVYRATSPSGTKTALGNWQTATSYDDTTASPGTTYYYWVTGAINSIGWNETAFSSYDTGCRGAIGRCPQCRGDDGIAGGFCDHLGWPCCGDPILSVHQHRGGGTSDKSKPDRGDIRVVRLGGESGHLFRPLFGHSPQRSGDE